MSNAREVERLVRRACAEDGPSVDPEAMRALKRAVRADENAGREVERGEEDASGDGDGGALRAVETF